MAIILIACVSVGSVLSVPVIKAMRAYGIS